MADELANNYPSFTEADIANPAEWLEGLSNVHLRNYLRHSIWTRNALPLIVPQASRLAIELSSLIKDASSALRTRVRDVIPQLLQEWGRDDAAETLDILLILCGRLRCAGATSVISLLLSERLGGQADEIRLRQRCLSVLSGFGCTERTEPIFERYLDDLEYAAICYRALYRFDRRYAAVYFSDILVVFPQELSQERNFVLDTLVRDLASPKQVAEFLIQFLAISTSDEILNGLEVMLDAGVFTRKLISQATSNQRVKVFEVFLKRCEPTARFRRLLIRFGDIGINYLCTHRSDDTEYVEILISSSELDLASEQIIETSQLSESMQQAISGANEQIAQDFNFSKSDVAV